MEINRYSLVLPNMTGGGAGMSRMASWSVTDPMVKNCPYIWKAQLIWF